MGLSFDLGDEGNFAAARIKVVGVGGAGGNAIRNMIEAGVADVEFVVANTDVQALNANPADLKIQLGRSLTKGLGAGASPEVGKKAAMEDIQLIQEHLQGADMVFVTAGMGGGTGTGAAPVIAQVARDLGALTVGVVSKPFPFEGRRRSKFADLGLEELANHVDTLITIPNGKLLTLEDATLTFADSFRKADEVLVNAVQGISDLIQQNGVVNVDFADVKTIMSSMGMALMGIGYGRGDRRAIDAAHAAINSPLLDNMSVQGATGILLNFMGGPDMRLQEVNEAATLIMDEAHEDANIIFGAVINPDMRDMIKVTVIATGFGRSEHNVEARVAQVSNQILNPMTMNGGRMHNPSYAGPKMTGAMQLPSIPKQMAVGEGRTRGSVPAPSQPGPQSRRPPSNAPTADFRDDEWDLPAFLRKSGGHHEG
ncbi:MAG: cell division protein FtsZ [Polyangiales bacterium]